eukprot:1717783-Prorocentrum_lima.AAC.1
MNQLDIFQLKGLRQILHLKTTFIEPRNTNAYAYEKATEAVRRGTPHSLKKVLPLSQVYLNRKILLLADILAAGPTDPRYHMNFEDSSFKVRADERKR